VVEEYNIYDNVGLARWLARRVGREDNLETPAVFVGDHALIGPREISSQDLELLVQAYAPTGALAVWDEYQSENNTARVVQPMRIAVAGLLDGLNPCAFATLIFFVSYLTVSGRKSWQVLAVGGAFALGVFLAYLAIGLGLYKVLDLVRAQHKVLGYVVTGLTGVLCLTLAVLSFADFLRARRGQIKEMALVLPESLRRAVNTVIRRSSSGRAFVLGAFLTGATVSVLELACTGQVYFATLVSMVGSPEGQARALPMLLLYNLMFILPLVVVFVLVYFGASSLQLGLFLRRHLATVKIGTALLFAMFAGWLLVPLIGQFL
jgi:cytochrome c biogenesis protein CcdA